MNGISNGSQRLNAGETLLSLSYRDRSGDEKNETYVLRPTMRKHSIVSRRFGGIGKAREALQAEDFDAIVFLIRNGTDMTDKDAKNLDDKIWQNGIDIDLLLPLYRYIAILNNGGRPLPDEIDQIFSNMTDVSEKQDLIEDHAEGNG